MLVHNAHFSAINLENWIPVHFLLLPEVHTLNLSPGELKSIFSCSSINFLKTLLQLTFDSMDVLRCIAYQEVRQVQWSVDIGFHVFLLVIYLYIENAIVSLFPRGTPISCCKLESVTR